MRLQSFRRNLPSFRSAALGILYVLRFVTLNEIKILNRRGGRNAQIGSACFAGEFPGRVVRPMLDLNFVSDNLPLVEEQLRKHGMRSADVLMDFAQGDAQRRQGITSAE